MNKLILTTLMLGSLYRCSSGAENEIFPIGDKIVVSQVSDGNGRKILTVDNEPFFLLGTQIRIDGLTNYTGEPVTILDRYVAAAKELGFTYVRIPIEWKDIEPEENVYDFSQVSTILSICKKYDMKMELAWFSINMCGEAMHCIVPEYIWLDPVRFPIYEADENYRFSSIYGYRTQLRMSEQALRERETAVVEKLMNHIYKWEQSYGFPKVMIGVQVYNEADLFLDRGYNSNYVMTFEEAWDDIATSMGQISKVFKQASYNVATNHNFAKIKGDDVPGRTDIANVRRIFDLEGIDYVAWDPYISKLYDVTRDLGLMKKYIPESIWLISENNGQYENSDRLILSSYAKGCSYNIYDLASPPYYISKIPTADYGILDPNTLADRPHTESVRRIIKALVGAGHIITELHTDDFAAFNIHEENAVTDLSQTINTTTATVGFSTGEGAMGFALAAPDYITVYTSGPAQVSLSNGTFSDCQKGRYEKGEWLMESSVTMGAGNSFACAANSMYRVKVESITAPQESNTDDFKL